MTIYSTGVYKLEREDGYEFQVVVRHVSVARFLFVNMEALKLMSIVKTD